MWECRTNVKRTMIFSLSLHLSQQLLIQIRGNRFEDMALCQSPFAIPDLDREVKWHCKYARQNGIHVSPTFMIDGLVKADMSSGDPVVDWVSRLLQQ